MSSSDIRAAAFPDLSPREAARPAEPDPGTERLREAQRIARSIVKRAHDQAEGIEALAKEQGLEVGRAQVLAEEGPALKNAAAALYEAASRLEGLQEELMRAVKDTVPKAVIGLAERILRRELSLRTDSLAVVIQDALKMVLPAGRVQIRLHPEDLATLQRHRHFVAEAAGSAEVRLEAAPEVGLGGCQVETEAMTLTAGLFDQLERALEILVAEDGVVLSVDKGSAQSEAGS